MITEATTQEEAVKLHLLKYGELTSYTAIHEYGITRLASRIFELRKKGFNILTNSRSVVTRFGNTAQVAVYKLNNFK